MLQQPHPSAPAEACVMKARPGHMKIAYLFLCLFAATLPRLTSRMLTGSRCGWLIELMWNTTLQDLPLQAQLQLQGPCCRLAARQTTGPGFCDRQPDAPRCACRCGCCRRTSGAR